MKTVQAERMIFKSICQCADRMLGRIEAHNKAAIIKRDASDCGNLPLQPRLCHTHLNLVEVVGSGVCQHAQLEKL